jgi:hypothetical protein
MLTGELDLCTLPLLTLVTGHGPNGEENAHHIWIFW